MEAELSRLQSELGNADFRITELRRKVDDLEVLLRGAEPQVVQTPSGIPGFNKQWIVPAVTMGDVPADDSAEFNHPFKLTVATDENGAFTWRVDYEGSTVTDGTNGSSIDLTLAGFDADNTFSDTKYIVLEADVDTSLVVTGWTLTATGTGGVDEVEMDLEGSPTSQIKVRLLIGKVAIEGTTPDQSPVAYQACYTAQMIVHGFLNGSLVKVFAAAPVNASDL